MSPRPAKAPEQPVENTVAPTPTKAGSARSRTRGDAPQAILDRYLIERDRQGRPARFYRDHRATEPMFRDEGRKLTTTQSYPDTVADMPKIAQHRGWTEVRVSGDEGFRREAWIQARSVGVEAKGYRPRDRDRQAAGEPSVARSPSSRHLDEKAVEERLRAASVVVKRLIEDTGARTRLMERAIRRLHNALQHSHARDRDASRDRRP